MLTLPDPGQALYWLGGSIDVRVEIDTGLAGASFGLWGSALWGSALWGSEEPDWTDITEVVEDIAIEQGTERWGQRMETGSAQIVLSNEDGRFTPDSGVAAFHLPFRPGRRIRVVAIPDLVSGVKVPQFTGFIDSSNDQYDEGGYLIKTTLNCLDFMAAWGNHNPSALVTPTGGQDTHDRVAAALDRQGWPDDADNRDIQEGVHTMQTSHLAQTTLEECQRAADAEGGHFFCSKDGKAVFKARDWLITDERPVVVQGYMGFDTIPALNPGRIYRSWSSNGTGGVAFDGQYLLLPITGDQVEKVDPATGDVADTISVTMTGAIRDITWDGTSIWLVTSNDELLRVDPDDGTVLDTFDLFSIGGLVALEGVAWDGTNLRVAADTGTHDIFRIDPSDGSTIDFIEPGLGDLAVLDHYDGYLWAVDLGTGTLFQIDPDDGLLIDTFVTTASDLEGIGWANGKLWYLDDSDTSLYEIGPPSVAQVEQVEPSWELARIVNLVEFARVGSTMQMVEDETSQGQFDVRSYQRTDLENNTDAEVLFLAERYLSMFKDNRPRIDRVKIGANADPDNLDLNRLLWDTQLGDRLLIKVDTPYDWEFEREVQVMGMSHHITGEDWEVTLKLNDAQPALARDALVSALEPLAWWQFSEVGGTSTADDSGNAHGLTWSGTPTLTGTGGPNGTGLVTLDGTDDRATVASEAALELWTGYSIEFWFRPHDSAGADQGIITCRTASPGGGETAALYEVYYEPTVQRVEFWPGSTAGAMGLGSGTESVEPNEWQHVVLVVDRPNAMFYLNGELVSSTSALGETAPTGTGHVVVVGRRSIANDLHFDGDLGEVVFYDRVLTLQQVQDLFAAAY